MGRDAISPIAFVHAEKQAQQATSNRLHIERDLWLRIALGDCICCGSTAGGSLIGRK